MAPAQVKMTQPLKIIQVFNRYLQPGGEEKSVERIASDLETAGHHVIRFWRASAEWQSQGAPPKWKQPWLLWHNAAVLDELRHVQERERADLWILHNVIPVVSLGVYGLARRLGVPLVQWLHNYRPLSPGGELFAGRTPLRPDDPWLRMKECWRGSWRGRLLTSWLALGYAKVRMLNNFSAVRAWIAVSEEMKEVFRLGGWFPDKLYSVQHSWHIDSEVSSQDSGYFMFLGRMIEVKGVRFLVKLWSHPSLKDLHLYMAGQGPVAEELRATSPSNVHWLGFVEGNQKRELVARCRALLFPCLWSEPLSTVAYEAYQAGKPILASNLGGMKEVIQDGRTGRLLAPGDEADWLRAITGLDEITSQKMGCHGRAWLEENASPEAWNRSFERVMVKAGLGRQPGGDMMQDTSRRRPGRS